MNSLISLKQLSKTVLPISHTTAKAYSGTQSVAWVGIAVLNELFVVGGVGALQQMEVMFGQLLKQELDNVAVEAPNVMVLRV